MNSIKKFKIYIFLTKKINIKISTLLLIGILMISIGAIYHRLQLFPFPLLSKIYYNLKEIYPTTFGDNLYYLKTLTENKNYVFKNERSEFILINNYKSGDNIYSDRLYFDHSNTNKLDNLILVQIPRHRQNVIKIRSDEPLIIYRVLCSNNDNNIYLDWIETKIETRIIGKSCVHHKVVKKEFNTNLIVLPSGGPASSDPIFIKYKNTINIEKNFYIE